MSMYLYMYDDHSRDNHDYHDGHHLSNGPIPLELGLPRMVVLHEAGPPRL